MEAPCAVHGWALRSACIVAARHGHAVAAVLAACFGAPRRKSSPGLFPHVPAGCARRRQAIPCTAVPTMGHSKRMHLSSAGPPLSVFAICVRPGRAVPGTALRGSRWRGGRNSLPAEKSTCSLGARGCERGGCRASTQVGGGKVSTFCTQQISLLLPAGMLRCDFFYYRNLAA